VCSTAFSDERKLFNLPSMIFFFDNLDVDGGAAYNLNKMMKIPFSLCALMYHISVKLYLCKDVC